RNGGWRYLHRASGGRNVWSVVVRMCQGLDFDLQTRLIAVEHLKRIGAAGDCHPTTYARGFSTAANGCHLSIRSPDSAPQRYSMVWPTYVVDWSASDLKARLAFGDADTVTADQSSSAA